MSINILITGDFCPINRIQDLVTKKSYGDIFNDFLDYSQNVDLAISNLECPLTHHNIPIRKSGPAIKGIPDGVNALKYAGFNLVTLANNHVLDYGSVGLIDTLDNCQKVGIDYVGAGRNLEEARKAKFYEIKGKRIAIYNVAENEFGNTYDDKPGGNPLDPVNNSYDIKDAKKHADYLFVIVHGGREHYQLPSPRVQQLYRFFIDNGADAVVGHHTHCYSGYENYNGKPIFYSLGNFVFDYKKKYQKGLWVEGYAVQFNIENDELSFELIPYFQGRECDPTLKLFNEIERKAFDEKIAELNATIVDNGKLQLAWSEYLQSQELAYKGSLYIQNKYIRELIRRKLIPPFFLHSEEHALILLNLLRCETHREIVIGVLNEDSK